jgi:hypothetical protein
VPSALKFLCTLRTLMASGKKKTVKVVLLGLVSHNKSMNEYKTPELPDYCHCSSNGECAYCLKLEALS